MIKAIIVDDETDCSDVLSVLLEKHCPSVNVIAIFNSPEDSIPAITEMTPDVLFLDVEMPGMNGFDVLERIKSTDTEVIFTTAHDSYAIKAIRFSALDYLLKPVQPSELQEAVRKLEDKHDRKSLQMQMDLLLKQVSQPVQSLDKIALSTSEGLEIIDVEDILYCEAQSNYTMFHFRNGKRMLASKTLKQVDQLLKDHNFFRVHQSYLVNLRYIAKYVRGDGSYVLLENDVTVSVAQSRKESLTRRLTKM